jgi:voltage-gated potassium channel Kch
MTAASSISMTGFRNTGGVESYYGDAARPELLHAAGIESARAIVIAIDTHVTLRNRRS